MINFKKDSTLEYSTYYENSSSISSTNLVGLIMVKNQEDYILKTIASIYSICDYIVVVDTGSTDETINRIKKKYPSVTLKYLDWEEDYAKMRNLCLEFISNNSWILFIDSDEILKSSLNYNEIHSFLNHLDEYYDNQDIICTVKQKQKGRPVFCRPERFIKKTSNIFYYGYVHEEVRTNNIKSLLKIDTSIEIFNHGTTGSEFKKFDKEKRYAKLLIKNIEEEPDNPRWVSLINSSLISNHFLSYTDYISLLKKHILIDNSTSLSTSNIIRSPYLSYLLERYCIELIKSNEDKLAIEYINFAQNIFPYDANFKVFEVTLFLQRIEKETYQVLKNIIIFIENSDTNIINEASEGSEESLTGVTIRLLTILGKKDKARELYEKLSDELIKEMLTNEMSL
ncbi:glycosyltransferase [Lactococcus carnosus]|uniref:glycosyltransferase n=1 Tax=Pseudolactococcus carnosus TaxID=2749961 RepID=UPI0008127483|nr:glycosyltransferase [Lactococcus carnosus]SCA91928.1 putative glycosyl transferase (similar to Plantaricin biosynthesis protein PlnO) [Lactococcus piscium]MCJ1968871.1 glycosyltransferase [Lactococcus carnosus]MCJ1974063.1 glycosyltransferase [Lactococcus carnosus]MCJ1981105.1 glycosyltransferase [Lactococcus carnosus]MCJ1987783.1 glycosyltransferase [Lactococcus carnosus]